MSTVLVFVLGLMLGSFLNVVIYRLPRRQSVVHPGSRCPSCGTPIRLRDNVPLVSYLVLRGRCRACGARIPPRYPLVELAGGLLLTAAWLRMDTSLDAVAAAAFSLLLLAIFFIDLEHQIVPNALTYPGLLIGLVLAFSQGRGIEAAATAAGAGALFLLIAVISHGGMGGGDIKLAAMMGAFLGWPDITVALLLAFALGAGAGLLLIAMKRRSRKDPIPFGPALAVGGILALFGAQNLLRWYLGS